MSLASELLIWGIVAHLIADWPLQNDWMARHKADRRARLVHRVYSGQHPDLHQGAVYASRVADRWWDRHPAAYVHAGIHGVLLALVFGWVALPLAVAHLLIDTRKPVIWFSQLVKQTQPGANGALVDIGLMVRFWTDQVWHIACIALAALAVGA